MKSYERKLSLFLPFLTFFFLVSACQNSTTEPATKQSQTTTKQDIPKDAIVLNTTGAKGGKLILSLTANPKMFNPIIQNDTESSKLVEGHVFLGLMKYNHKTLKNDLILAKALDISEDSLVYTFTLREGLKWSDGHPFSVEDVLFNLKAITDPKILTGKKDLLRQSDGSFPKVEKIDGNKVRFTLKEPNAMFEAAIGSIYLGPKHKLEKAYEEGNLMNAYLLNANPKDIVGMGPYVIEKFLSDQLVSLKRNPHFFMYDKNGVQLPYLDKLVRVIAPDFNAIFLKFQNGDIDMVEVRPEHYDALKRGEKSGDYTVFDLGPALITYYLQFNLNPRSNKDGQPYVAPKKLKVFNDKRFRQAISYAIDRKSIVQTAFHGRATAIYNLQSPGNKNWYNPNVKKYPFDLKKAKELLKEMGLKDSNRDGYLDFEDGSPIQFTMKTNSENHTRIQIANTIKEDFGKIGLKASLNPVPFNSLLTSINDTFDYDAYILGWANGVPPDPAVAKNMLLSSGRSHSWNPRQETPATEWEKRIDELVVKNVSTPNMEERRKYYDEIQEIWGEQLPQTMIVAPNFYVAIKNKYGNIKPSVSRTYFDWNVYEIYDKNYLKK